MRSPMVLASIRILYEWVPGSGTGETWDGGSLTQCVTGTMRPLLGSHKVMFDLELGTPMSQSHRNAVARTPGSIYRATSADAEDTHFN